jgi:hypothetical protein
MARISIIVMMLSLVLFSCKKEALNEPAPVSLEGKWRMFNVVDNISGLTVNKPASTTGNVDLIFTSAGASGGTFIGKTPSNDIWQNTYFTGSNQSITIPVLSMTKVMEGSWGLYFVNNIIDASVYSFEVGGVLNIITSSKKTLMFHKIQ